MNNIELEHPKIVSEDKWLVARKAHLEREKALTRLRDQVSAERRELPWVKIEKNYVFDTPNGKETLGDLFDGRSQLIVYHFMLGPSVRDGKEGCESCSFLVDHVDGANVHLAHHDVTFVAISRTPLSQIEPFKNRMGWRFKWVSSYGSDFNYDFHVSATKDELAKGKMYYNYEMVEFQSEEQPGISVFYKDKTGQIFHTYSSYGRGGDILIGTYNYLDLTPFGRREEERTRDGLGTAPRQIRLRQCRKGGNTFWASSKFQALKVRAAIPARLPDFVEPMKAKLVESMPSGGGWIYEIKFDGYRALALRGGSETRVLSRNEKDLGGKFTEVQDSIAALDLQGVIIDGEIVALDEKGRSSFQLLQSFDMGQERPPIVFYAFDLLQLNGKTLQNLPIEERKAKLEGLLKKPPGVLRYSASFTKDIPELLDRARTLGLEGLISKRSGSRYEPGKRSGAWIKIKLHLEQEFVIGGYTEPEGSRKYFGALLVGFFEGKNLKFAGRVGTGFSEKFLSTLFSELNKIRIEKCPFYNIPAAGRNLWDQGLSPAEMKRCHWVKPVMVCHIRFTEWTRDDRLRQPVFLGIGEDKDANEVVREEAS